jgi:hypothetical protein
MFTKNIKDTFTANLLSAVSGVLGEAKKKCSADCKCEACMKEGYMPTNDAPSDKDRKTAGKLGTLLKREREAKEKKEPNGVKESNDDVPFEGPYRKAGERKDEYGNKVKNVAKHLAKKAMKANEEVEELDEDHQYVELTNAHTNSKSYIPVHKTQAFAALNHYRSFSHNSGVRIIDKKQHDAIQAAKTPWNPSGESRSPFKEELEEAWVVKKGTEVVSSHKTKDEADVKAMKNRMYKVYAKEETEIEEAVGDITVKKISPDEAFKKHIGQMTKKTSTPKDPKTGKTLYQKMTSEEAEQIDEISKDAALKYLAANKKDDTKAKESGDYDRVTKRMRGTDMAVRKYTAKPGSKSVRVPATEEVELDEGEGIVTPKKGMSYATRSSDAYRKYAKENPHMLAKKTNKEAEDDGWYTHAQMYGSKKSVKHPKGISAAEWKSGIRWHHGKNKRINVNESNDDVPFEGPYRKAGERKDEYGNKVKNVAKHLAKKAMKANEEVELDEARGRPKKAGAKDFTIHPRTKEKLMHDNPAHMKKIELLQKNGILQKPKTEAGQNIMTQLQKAKTSMTGGTTIHFTHGDSKEVSGTHAAKLLDKHAGMKPTEKEAFQKKIGHSHANLKSEL